MLCEATNETTTSVAIIIVGTQSIFMQYPLDYPCRVGGEEFRDWPK